MEISLQDITEEQPTEEQPQHTPITHDSIQRKRDNKIYKCQNCGKSLSRKTLLYSHNCMNKETKPDKQIDVPAPVVRETIREVIKHPEITDTHIQEYINRKTTEQQEKAKQDREARFNKLIQNAF